MNQFNQRFNLLVIVGYHAIVKSFLLFPDFHVGDIGEIENIVQYIYIHITCCLSSDPELNHMSLYIVV